MNARTVELSVGFFVLLFLAAMFLLAIKVSNLASFGSSNGYSVIAYFENIGGLKPRAPVSASGVRVGQVSKIEYDPATFRARVTLSINKEYDEFPLDTIASIYTAGLLGEQYIGLDPGGDIEYLTDGSEFEITQSALVLERLIGRVLVDQ